MFAGRLISEMALRTGSAPKDVSAIADQLRLAPYRAKELVHMRDHILPDGSVDFSARESGSEDPVGGKGRGFGKFVSLYSKHMDKVSSKLYHGARHEILNEIGKEEVYSDILSFLEGVVDE